MLCVHDRSRDNTNGYHCSRSGQRGHAGTEIGNRQSNEDLCDGSGKRFGEGQRSKTRIKPRLRQALSLASERPIRQDRRVWSTLSDGGPVPCFWKNYDGSHATVAVVSPWRDQYVVYRRECMFSAPGDCVLSCICNHSAAVHSSVAVCGPRLAAPMRAQPSGVVLIMAPAS